jgi:hypothetical protein
MSKKSKIVAIVFRVILYSAFMSVLIYLVVFIGLIALINLNPNFNPASIVVVPVLAVLVFFLVLIWVGFFLTLVRLVQK